MKTKSLILTGLMVTTLTASPVMAYGYRQPYYQQPPVVIQQQPAPVIIQQPRPSTLETVLGIAVIGAGLYWNSPAYQNDYGYYNGNRNHHHHNQYQGGKTYVICNDHGRRYYC